MNVKKVEIVDLENKEHAEALLLLLNEYMKDEMGWGKEMPVNLKPKIINGLKKHKAYIGFLVKFKNEYVALANCNLNYSTWNAKFIINIHDFVVHAECRKLGLGQFLLNEIEKYAKKNNCCKLNLEVREDNLNARGLYEKVGFSPSFPQMLFWEKSI